MGHRLKAAALAALLLAPCGAAQAAQFVILPDIIGPSGYVTRYVGPGTQGSTTGAVNDGGRDAMDGYGYFSATGGLALSRQTEAFTDQNLFRFFDTFTNTGADTVTRTVTFFGNLGSDSATALQARGPGYLVTCQGSGQTCGSDPVVAGVHSGNGLGQERSLGEQYWVDYTLTLAPGESASLLNFAFLASELSGTQRSDVVLASERALDLTNNPYLAGLTQYQLSTVRNYDLGVASPVPEPATWSMMIAGFGLVGATLRRRRVTVGTALA